MFPPVNIEELDDKYEISFFAAGYSKSDFKISLADDTLTVSGAKESKGGSAQDPDWEDIESRHHHRHWRNREFKLRNFERHFILNDKINRDEIQAKYEDGVLKITLSKKEGAETIRTNIDIG
jgi:HSP20 family protein